MKTLEADIISRSLIDVPAEYERKEHLVEDDALRNSIKASGIQQPLVVLSKSNGRYALIDGYRRFILASELRIQEVPAIIDAVPDGENPRNYQDRVRFILDEHRQDLFPSQRAELIAKLKEMFDMTNKDVAAYLGVDAGSITNWLAVLKYSPTVVKAIDTGEINSHAARAFDGMTEEAQDRVLKKHRDEFTSLAGNKLHKLIRSIYSPKTHPEYYRDPDKTAAKIKTKKIGRKSKSRPSLSSGEKIRLSRDLALQETELRDGREELKTLTKEINLATPPIRAIMRDKNIVALLPENVKEEFERFAEVYV